MIKNVDFQNTLETAFLAYAASIAQERAIPDVRDGLKIGLRQGLYAQYTNKLTHNPFAICLCFPRTDGRTDRQTDTHTHTHTHTRMCVSARVCTCVSVSIYTYECTPIDTHTTHART